MKTRYLSLTAIATSLSLTACPQSKNSQKPGQETVESHHSGEGILVVHVEVYPEDRSYLLSIGNIPDRTVLECQLDAIKLENCTDHRRYDLPKEDGEYTVSVAAKNDQGNVQAIGIAKLLVGTPSQSTADQKLAKHHYRADLTLEVDPAHLIHGAPFTDGMAIKRTDGVSIKFRFKETPSCNPKIRCVTDRTNSKWRPLCDQTLAKSYRGNTMPLGLQYLTVTAECGDKVGDSLRLHWYGVPANYSYMGLSSTYFATKDTFRFNLMNPSDCPQNLLAYQCRYTGAGSFGKCRGDEPNVIKNPPEGFAIRGVCNGRPYAPYFPNRS